MHPQLRIALYEPFGGGGIFHYTFELAESLSRQGAAVTLFTHPDHEFHTLARPFEIRAQLERSEIKTWLQAQVARLLPRRSGAARPPSPGATAAPGSGGGGRVAIRRLILWLELAAACLRRRCQVMHVQWLLDPEQDYHLLRLLKLLGCRIVYTAHNLLPHESDSPRDRAAFQRIYRLADRIIVHAERNREEVIDEFDLDGGRIAVVPHGAYDLFFRGGTLDRQEARNALGLPPDRRIILFFGSVRRYKGLEYLVDAFRKVKHKVDGLLLLVVGTVKTPNAEDFGYYSNLLAELSTEEDVVCRSGYVPVERVPSYFSASDLVAIPYVKTYQSGILALAYAAGRPVVVTDTGGLAEVVDAGKSGLVVPPGDVDRLAEAILGITADPAVMETMGRHAKYLADTKYSWNDIAAKTMDVYRAAIGGSRRRSH